MRSYDQQKLERQTDSYARRHFVKMANGSRLTCSAASACCQRLTSNAKGALYGNRSV
jgi:hypothetical protein